MSIGREKPRKINFSIRERIVPGSMIGIIPYIAEAMAHVTALADFHEKSYVFTEKLETPNYHDISWADPIDYASTQIQTPNPIESLLTRPIESIPEIPISKIYDQILAREVANTPMMAAMQDAQETQSIDPNISTFIIDQSDDPDNPQPPPPTEENTPPIAELTSRPGTLTTDLSLDIPIIFDAQRSYDSDGKIISFNFNYGDGNSAMTGNDQTSHMYTSPPNITYGTVTVTDDGGLTSQASTPLAQPIFLNPGDTNPMNSGVENTLIGDSSHTYQDNPNTTYIEGKMDAVKNDGSASTLNNVVQEGQNWTAIANAYTPDGRGMYGYQFWIDDNKDTKFTTDEYVGFSTSGQINIDHNKFNLNPGESYEMAVRGISNSGLTSISYDTFSVNTPPDVVTDDPGTPPPNTPYDPNTNPDPLTVHEDSSNNVIPASRLLANDFDADGDDLTITSISFNGQTTTNGTISTLNGSLSFNASSQTITYTPNPDYFGNDSFTYEASDGKGGYDSALVTIDVLPVNDEPDFATRDISVAEDSGASTFTLSQWTQDIDLGPANESNQTIIDYDITGITYANLVGPAIDANGILTFTAAPNVSGEATVSVRIKDSGGTERNGDDTSRIEELKIRITPVNDPFVDDNEDNSTLKNTPIIVTSDIQNDVKNLLNNAVDPENDILTITQFEVAGLTGTYNAGQVANIPGVGDLRINADGSYIFNPETDYFGVVPVVTYTITDGVNLDTSTLTITVNATNSPPTAILGLQQYALTGTSTPLIGENSSDPDNNITEYKYEIYRKDNLGNFILIDADPNQAGINPLIDSGSPLDGNVTFIFNSIGEYKVKLTVTDGEGLSNFDEKLIKVVNPLTGNPSIDVGNPSGGTINFSQYNNGNTTTSITGAIDHTGDPQDGYRPPEINDQGYNNPDNSGNIGSLSFGVEGGPTGFTPPPPPEPEPFRIKTDAWITLNAGASNPEIVGKYEFDFDNDGIVDFTEQKVDLEGDGVFESYSFILDGTTLINPTDSTSTLNVDITTSGIPPILYEVSINPTEVFTTELATENFLNTFNFQTSLASGLADNYASNPTAVKYGWNTYTIKTYTSLGANTEVGGGDDTYTTQEVDYYIVPPGSNLDTTFDGVTRFKYLLGANDNSMDVPHAFNDYTEITLPEVSARVRLTDNIFGLSAEAVSEYNLDLTSLIPPITQVTVSSVAHDSEFYQGVGVRIDASSSFDIDVEPDDGIVDHIREYLFDIDGDGTFDFKQGSAVLTHVYDEAGTHTIKVATIDNGERLGNIVTLQVDLQNNALPTLNLTQESSLESPFNIYETYGITTRQEPIIFKANAGDTNGSIVKWEFTFTYIDYSTGADVLKSTPDYVEWKAGYDHDKNGAIEGLELQDFAEDGVADGIITHTYTQLGTNLQWKATVYDDLGASKFATKAITVIEAINPDLQVENEVINPTDPLTNVSAVASSSSLLPGAEIVKYEFDFNDDGNIDYIEWKAGYDHDGSGDISTSENTNNLAGDGSFDGTFSGEYFFADQTARPVELSVKVTDSLGNYRTSTEGITLNANPIAEVRVYHADPKNPGTASLLDARTFSYNLDDQDIRDWYGFFSGINRYDFTVLEDGDTDGDGDANELVYSYSEQSGGNHLYDSVIGDVTNYVTNNPTTNSLQFSVGTFTSETFTNLNDFRTALANYNSAVKDGTGNFVTPGEYQITVTLGNGVSSTSIVKNAFVNAADGVWSGTHKYDFQWKEIISYK